MKKSESTIPPGKLFEVAYLPEFPGAKTIKISVDTNRDQDNLFQLGMSGDTMTVHNFMGWWSAFCNKRKLQSYLEDQIINQIKRK